MESVYWAISWACHRSCSHCYDERFHPYSDAELKNLVEEGVRTNRKVIAGLPESFLYLDPARPGPDGQPSQRIGRIILSGGEVLIDPVREQLFYPILDEIQAKYWGLEARIVVETTGDLLEPRFITEMTERGVWMIAIGGMDAYHDGLHGDAGAEVEAKIRAMMRICNVQEVSLSDKDRDYGLEEGPFFVLYGAKPKSWIGSIWPRGRAWTHSLSSADYETNFCARRSGGRGFLDFGMAGSEISIEPNGDIFPCNLKTKTALGNLTEERLIDILDSIRDHPAFQAINAGDPEGMGVELGWSRDDFRDSAHTKMPDGRQYANPCIGCDRFFEAKLGKIVNEIRAERKVRRDEAHAARLVRADPTAGLFD